MRDAKTPSVSARIVAWLRSLAAFTPARDVAPDDASVRLAGFPFSTTYALMARAPRLSRAVLGWSPALSAAAATMAMRTREIDDAIKDFVASGGTQVVLLGVGLDARSVRLASLFQKHNVKLFEVDSPGSQANKLAALRASGLADRTTAYVAHDFEAEALASLPGKLADCGLVQEKRTLTVLEGVVMYLSLNAANATLDAVKQLGCRKSVLLVNHVDSGAAERLASFKPWRLHSWTFWPMFFEFVRVWAGERLRPPSQGGIALGEEIESSMRDHGSWSMRSNRDDAETARRAGLAPGVIAASGMRVAVFELQ